MKIFQWMLLIVMTLSLFSAGGLEAATRTWTAGGDGSSWSDAANWGGNVPGAGDVALFDGSAGIATFTVNVPAGTTLDGIVVASGANPDRNITFNLLGTLTLNNDDALTVDDGDTATFTGAGSRVIEVFDDVYIGEDSSLILTSNITLRFNGSVYGLYVSDGATFDSAGQVLIANETYLYADNAGGATVITFNNIHIAGVTFYWDIDTADDVDVTINGEVMALADGAELDIYNELWSDNDRRFNITMHGNFDANSFDMFELEVDYAYWTFPGASAFVTGLGGSFDTLYFGLIHVPAGGSLTMPNNAFFAGSDYFAIYMLEVDGTFTVGNNPLEFYGSVFDVDSLMIRVDAAATFTQTGGVEIYPYDNDFTWEGTITFGGDVAIDAFTGAITVTAGSFVTFNGDFQIGGGQFGAYEDGATASSPATITYNGDVWFDAADSLLLGEGIHSFAGDVDLGDSTSTDFVVALPQNAGNDFFPEIHLIGGAQSVQFNTNWGSHFFVTSMANATRVTQTGIMILIGADFTGATGTTGTVCWDGTGGTVALGGGDLEITPNTTNLIGRVTIGSLDVEFGNTMMEEFAGSANGNEGVRYIFRGAGAGILTIDGDLTIEGDTSDDHTGGERNGGRLELQNLNLVVTGMIEVADGAADGDGAEFIATGSSITVGVFQIGLGAATNDDEGPRAQISGTTLTVAATGNVNVWPWATFFFFNSTMTASTGSDYALFIDSMAQTVIILGSTITGNAANDISVVVGGQNLYLINSIFEHYDTAGVEFEAASNVVAIEGNTFRNGVNGGSHITLNGLANSTYVNCDSNLFDDSTGTATDALIDIVAGDNRLNFRCLTSSDFGLGAVTIDAATAEARDNDGTADGDVTWEEVPNSLDLNEAAIQPTGLITDGTANQTLGRFTLTATGTTSTVTEMTFTMSVNDAPGNTLQGSDILTATLYEDANSNGQFDSGENFTGCLNVTVTDGQVTFNVPNELVPVGTPQIWSVAITFAGAAAGRHGAISLYCLPVVGIEISNAATTIVTGMPLVIEDIPVTGPVSQIIIITQPSSEQVNTIISPSPVVELRDAAGNLVLGRSFNVVASIQSGGATGAVLGGTLTVASSTTTARATFTNLTINLAGTAYVLRFAIASPVVGVNSNPFDITAAPVPPTQPKKKKSGGGCAVDETANGGWAALAALLALMSLGAATRLRRQS